MGGRLPPHAKPWGQVTPPQQTCRTGYPSLSKPRLPPGPGYPPTGFGFADYPPNSAARPRRGAARGSARASHRLVRSITAPKMRSLVGRFRRPTQPNPAHAGEPRYNTSAMAANAVAAAPAADAEGRPAQPADGPTHPRAHSRRDAQCLSIAITVARRPQVTFTSACQSPS